MEPTPRVCTQLTLSPETSILVVEPIAVGVEVHHIGEVRALRLAAGPDNRIGDRAVLVAAAQFHQQYESSQQQENAFRGKPSSTLLTVNCHFFENDKQENTLYRGAPAEVEMGERPRNLATRWTARVAVSIPQGVM